MESTRITVTCELPIPLASGRDSLECGNGRPSPSRQEDSVMTYSVGSVVPGDRQSDITKDVCVADVGGAISRNGKVVHSPVMMTGVSSVEFSNLSAPSTEGSLPSGEETPLSNHSHFVSTVQAKCTVGLNPGQLGIRSLGSSNEVLSQPRTSQDSTLTGLEDFIIKTLNRNKSDRAVMLNLEADMAAFIHDSGREMWKFPPMSSYHRMLAHRVAAFFGLEHNVDDRGKSVVISRQQNTRIPDFKFRDHLSDDFFQDDRPKKSILKMHKDYTSLEESLGVDRITLDERKCKSFEERTGKCNEARNRIFQENPYDSKETQVVNLETNGECGSGDPAKNLDPDGCISHSAQLQVGTSLHNVCGNAQLSTPDAVISVTPDSVTTLPFETSAIPHDEAGGDGLSTGSPFLPFPDNSGEPFAIWVASTIGQIPPGSIIINPSKGEPYTNPDGSPYRWYPPSDTTEKKECSFGGPAAPDVEASAVSNEQQPEETRSPKDQSQEDLPVQASTVSASKVETAATAFAKSGNRTNSFPASSSSTKTQIPLTTFSGVTQPVFRTDMTTCGMSVSDCHACPAPVLLPAYGANPAPVRFMCPQPLIYPSTVGVLDQQTHVVDGASYGYIPTYATDSFQATSFPPVVMPLPPTETYQPLPSQLVQYADKTWNQYQQPMVVVPQQGASGGQVYYGMESALGSQGGVSSQTHPVQVIFVSSGSSADLNQPVLFTSQASVMSGGIMESAQPAYLNIGPGAQPQYIPYAYRPNQPQGGAVLPFYTVSVPVPALSAPPHGPTPCLAPVARRSAPVSGRILQNQSPSSKSFQFSVPPPPIGVSTLSRTFRPPESTSSPIRVDGGQNQAWSSNRPTLNIHRPRFDLARPPRANVAFPPMNINKDDPRCPRLPQNRMVLPLVSSNRNHKPRSTVTSVNTTSSVSLSSELRKSSAGPHLYVGVAAEGMSKNPPCWKFARFPPTCRDKV